MDKAFAKWPLRGNVNVQLSKKVNLFKSLIKYSTNLDKIERFEKSKSLEYLDNLPEASLLIAEYNTQNTISPSTINNYKSFLKAQLLHEFKINHITEYCNTNMIISFFNDFNDNGSQIEDYWLIKAQKLSQKFPLDFCISIPNFTALDIISLLINPVTKKQGCIFDAIQVPTQIIGYFQNLLTLSISNIGQIPIEIFKIAKTFIQNNHPRLFDQYIKSTNDISEILYQIQNNNILTDIEYLIIIFQDVINISFEINQPFYNQLDLSDIKNLDFDNFNQYINQYPKKGFYICQYPETKEYFNSMHELCTNFGPQDEKIPLSLFEFRIFIQFYKIEFEPPKNVNLYDFPDLITKEINDNLNSRYFNLSHLIGLLLSNVPSFVTETFYSEYVRNIIINMITLPESDNIRQEMIKILKEMISQLIQMISADGWENTIEKQLNYNPEQKSIFNFLANPWRYTLSIIDQKIRPGYLQKVNDTIKRFDDIKSVLNDLTSSFTLHSLNNCIESDIDFFKTKAVQPLRRKIVPISQLNNARREFSKNAKLYYEYLIPEFPEFSMNRNSDPYVSEDFFDNLFNFLDENDTDDVSDDSHEIIAIIPNIPNSNYVRTLTYSTNFDRYKVTFKTLGNVMLFKPPNDEFISEDDIYSKTDSIRIFFLHYDDRVTNYNSSSIYNLNESFNNFIDIYRRYQDNRIYENRINRISHNLNQSSILFGGNNINEFTRKLVTLKYQSENKESIVQKAEYIERFNQEMASLKNVTFYVNVDLEDPLLRFSTPRDTTNYLLNILSNISFTNIDFRYYTNRLKNEESFRNECQELDDLITKSKSLSLKPTNENVINISDEDIEKNQNYILSAPLIFKEGDSLKVSAKTIEVTCDPLILGIDMSPFQIRLPNISNNEILCEFHQTNNDLPLPTFKNENDILIIEISTENLYNNALSNQSNSNDEEIDVEFKFEGTVSLRAKLDPNLTTEIEYSITLHYISLTTFILMEDKHYFAFKKDKVEIVPFLINSNSKLVFEKFYDHKINSTMIANTVSQLTDNNAIIPQFSDTSLNGQIYNFMADFSNEYNPKNSHISLNFEFGLEKEKSIIASFQTDILPPLTLAIFSDETQNFEKENIIINIGNLTRKVYFVVELLNNDKKEARISNVNIRTNDNNNLIYHNFDPNKNFQTIRPGKYGYIICFFEVRYSSPSPFQYQENIIDGTLVVEFEGKSQEINFKYMIQTVQIQESSIQYCGNKDNFYYYNLSNKKFIKCDIDEINDDTTFRGFEKQILLSPFSCNLFIKLNEYPKVSYNIQDGRLLGISNEAQKKIEYEVFSYLFDENKFEIKPIEDLTNIQINDKEIYILARIKDEPDSYFPLFCPINGKDIQFDLCENIEFENIYSIFFNFFTNMMTEDDFQERIRYLDKSLFNLFNYRQLLSLHNFSYLIDLFGKNRKSILFKRVIISISKFTNSYEIKNNFYLIINKYGEKNKNVRFYAFVSVLNKLINDRFIHLQEQQFYIQFPIDFDVVKKRQQNILNKVVKDESKDICKYIIDAKSRIKKINKYELEKKKEYEDNGFTITQVLKWDQKNGLTASNMDELKSYKKIKNKAFTKDIQVKNYLQFNNNNLTKFPEIISIKSIYQKFDEIFKFEYIIPCNIDELIQNSNFNQIKKLLNQLYILYDWQMKNSICFPFYSLKTKFTNILAFILNKFNISKLNLPFIPLDQFKPSIFELDFVQIPKLGYEQDDDDNKSQKDTNDENISEKEDEDQDNEENIEEYELYSESDAKEDNNNENDDQRNEENIEEDKLDKNNNEKEDDDDKKDVKNDDEDEEYDLNSENDAKEDDNDEKDIKNDEDEEYDLNSENDAKEKDNDDEDAQKNEENDLNSANDAKDSDDNEKNDSKENDNDEINDESTVNIQKDNNDGKDDDLEEDCYEIDNEEEENTGGEDYISSNINFLFPLL